MELLGKNLVKCATVPGVAPADRTSGLCGGDCNDTLNLACMRARVRAGRIVNCGDDADADAGAAADDDDDDGDDADDDDNGDGDDDDGAAVGDDDHDDCDGDSRTPCSGCHPPPKATYRCGMRLPWSALLATKMTLAAVRGRGTDEPRAQEFTSKHCQTSLRCLQLTRRKHAAITDF